MISPPPYIVYNTVAKLRHPKLSDLTVPVQTVTADSAHSHSCTSCSGLFFLVILNILRLHPPSSTLQALTVSVCFCVYTVCHYLGMKKLQIATQGHCVGDETHYSYTLICIYANTMRRVCWFATNSSPFPKVFFKVKFGLQFNVGWLSGHKLKRE